MNPFAKLIEAIRNQVEALRSMYGRLSPEEALYARIMLIVIVGLVLWLATFSALAKDYAGMAAVSPDGATVVTLRKSPCTDAKVLVFIGTEIKPQYRDGFHVAEVKFHGKNMTACWRPTDDGALVVVEDGSAGIVPYNAFSPII